MSAPPRDQLNEVKRQAVMDHVLAAARRLILANGLGATMDQIAEAAGISRRTLFRHFTSRDGLIAAAFQAGMADYRRQLPPYDGDRVGWLRRTCEAAHRMNATIGPGFFELASRSDLPDELAAVEERRKAEFGAAVDDIATVLWTASGDAGDPPHALRTAINAHLSPHFTAALMIDAGEGWEVAAELAFDAIAAAAPVVREPD